MNNQHLQQGKKQENKIVYLATIATLAVWGVSGDEVKYSRVSNSSAGTTSGFSAMGRPAWKQNRVPAAKIGNPALQLGKEKSAGRGPIRPGFLSISSPIDLRSGK